MKTTKKTKVLWLIKGLGAGGAEQLLAGSIPYLDRDRFDYEVGYLLPWKTDLVSRFEDAGVPIHCLKRKGNIDPMLVPQLVGLFRRRQVDLVHTHSPYAAVASRLASKLSGVKALVHTEHNMLPSYNPATRVLHRLTTRMGHSVIAVSREVEQSILDTRLFKPKALRVIPGGIDPNRLKGFATSADVRRELGIPAGHRVVGNVAHLRWQKGHGYLLQAAQRVLRKHPKTIFVIVGREKVPGYQKELEDQARELGIDDRVIFTGFQADPLRIVANFDVFLMSSIHEGLPIALLEAMALEKPPVVTAVGGIPEVIEDGDDGLLVEPKNPTALAEQVSRLLADDGLRQRIAKRAHAKATQRFSIQRMVEHTEQVYAERLGWTSETLVKEAVAQGKEEMA